MSNARNQPLFCLVPNSSNAEDVLTLNENRPYRKGPATRFLDFPYFIFGPSRPSKQAGILAALGSGKEQNDIWLGHDNGNVKGYRERHCVFFVDQSGDLRIRPFAGARVEAIVIPSNDESDLDSRSDTSFKSLGGLLSEARDKVQSSRISGPGKGVDAASDDHNAPEPSVTSMAGPSNESHASPITLHAEQERLVPLSPISRRLPMCAGWSRLPVDRCPKHPNWSVFCRQFQKAKADDEGNKGDEPEPADAGLPLPPPNCQLEAGHHPTNDMCPATPPQVVESWASTPTLPDDESTSELEPAGAEPRLQPQSPSGAASGRGVDPQQRSDSCGLSEHRDHRDDNDQASDPEQRHPLAPDDGEKNDEEGPAAPPHARESVAGLPTLLDDGGNDDHEPASESPPMQPPAGRDQANLQHTAGRCDATTSEMASERDLSRRRHRNTDGEEDYCPSVCSDAEHSEDDIVRPPPNKRRRGGTVIIATSGTASQQQARLSYSDASGGAQRLSRHPRRQRGAAYPPSSPGEDIEMDSTPAATFEELPLGDAVLKRVTRDGSPPTFMVQFT
ncbi:hypothetical protein N658DRAFT_509238 [Parathielavia hyrcaniae]|uniref:Uncharacterized protein n=1 Tax=Parathielavia hyrcaniae TaxID=113614 RepID=A0AAN6PVZ0_9PEZI|nr:hypothetical protein N658DRAFT_509238 [Parathielavia hyrcaniae]